MNDIKRNNSMVELLSRATGRIKDLTWRFSWWVFNSLENGRIETTVELEEETKVSVLFWLYNLSDDHLTAELSRLSNKEILKDSDIFELKKAFSPNNISLPIWFNTQKRDIIYARIAHLWTKLESDINGTFFNCNGHLYYTDKLFKHENMDTSYRITAFILNLELHNDKVSLHKKNEYFPEWEKLNHIYDFIDLVESFKKTDKNTRLELEKEIISFVQNTSWWWKDYFEEAMKYIKKSENKIWKNFKKLKYEIFLKYWEEHNFTQREIKILWRKYWIQLNSHFRWQSNTWLYAVENKTKSSGSKGWRCKWNM